MTVGDDAHAQPAAPAEQLSTRTERTGACVVIHVAGEIDFTSANLLRSQVPATALGR